MSTLSPSPHPGRGSATHDEVARTAFAIYTAQGSHHGNDLRNWLDAETQVRTGANSRPPVATAGSQAVKAVLFVLLAIIVAGGGVAAYYWLHRSANGVDGDPAISETGK